MRGRTLLLAAFGLCLGAIDVSVGPTESVILEMRSATVNVTGIQQTFSSEMHRLYLKAKAV